MLLSAETISEFNVGLRMRVTSFRYRIISPLSALKKKSSSYTDDYSQPKVMSDLTVSNSS